MTTQRRDVCEVICVNEEAVRQAQEQLLDPEEVRQLAETFKVMGDPTRVHIIQVLWLREMCVCDLATALGMSQSAVSHQLRVLRNLRLVKYRKEGKVVYYSLDDSHIINLFHEGLDHVRHD